MSLETVRSLAADTTGCDSMDNPIVSRERANRQLGLHHANQPTAFPPHLAYNEAAEDTHGLAAK
jgi:hypothetical protein